MHSYMNCVHFVHAGHIMLYDMMKIMKAIARYNIISYII